jgi:hypothetical protein
MVGASFSMLLAISAAAGAIAGHANGMNPAAVTMSPFGGSVPVHIAHVGHIEVALGNSGAARLKQVRCATDSAALSCYVAP